MDEWTKCAHDSGNEAATAAAKKARADLEWLEEARTRQHARKREHEKYLRKHQRTVAEVKAQSWQKELELEIARQGDCVRPH